MRQKIQEETGWCLDNNAYVAKTYMFVARVGLVSIFFTFKKNSDIIPPS